MLLVRHCLGWVGVLSGVNQRIQSLRWKALSAYAVLRFGVGREGDAAVSTVRLEMKLASIMMAAISFTLLITLVGYVFLENLTLR